jgi:hypothetical protein
MAISSESFYEERSTTIMYLSNDKETESIER